MQGHYDGRLVIVESSDRGGPVEEEMTNRTLVFLLENPVDSMAKDGDTGR